MDARFKPMLCEAGDAIPADAEAFRLEPKFDGWRAIVALTGAGAHIYGGRNGSDYSGKLPYLTDALTGVLPVGTVLDGELIAENGWGGVQGAMTRSGAHKPTATDLALTFVAFDVLELNDQDIKGLPWMQRRSLLEMVEWPAHTVLSPTGDATEAMHVKMLDMGMEGSVLKRTDSRYLVGTRSRNWIKLKAIASEDCEITGFEEGKNGRSGEVGAIVVRLPSGVETTASGMTDKVRADMLDNPHKYIGNMVEIAHNGIMASGKPRHPRFKRMRDDRSPAPAPTPAAPKRPRAPRSGPWMRNYSAMGGDKLLNCVRELEGGYGDAYQRVMDKGGLLGDHVTRAREAARAKGLI